MRAAQHLPAEGAPVVALAVSAPDLVSVLVDRPYTRYLEVYKGGSFVGADRLSRATAPALSASGIRVVFHTGRSIDLVDAFGEHGLLESFSIAHAAATPVGLSLEGKRVVWAENLRGRHGLRGRIRVALAP